VSNIAIASAINQQHHQHLTASLLPKPFPPGAVALAAAAGRNRCSCDPLSRGTTQRPLRQSRGAGIEKLEIAGVPGQT